MEASHVVNNDRYPWSLPMMPVRVFGYVREPVINIARRRVKRAHASGIESDSSGFIHGVRVEGTLAATDPKYAAPHRIILATRQRPHAKREDESGPSAGRACLEKHDARRALKNSGGVAGLGRGVG